MSGCGAARPTRTRLPTAVIETTSTVEVVAGRAGVGRVLGRERDLPRVDADGHRARRAVERRHDPAAVELDLRRGAGDRVRDAGQDDRAGEVGHERRRRLGGEPRRVAALDDPPAVDDRDLVAEQRRLREVVRDEQRGDAGRAQHAGQLAAGRRARARVERRQRLVEQQRPRAARQRPGQRHALALAARQRARARLGQRADPEALQQLLRALAAGAPRQPRQRVGDVLPRAQVPEQRVLLEDVAATAPLGRHVDPARGVQPDLLAARDDARLRPQQAGRHAQDRGLARSRRARERETAPRVDGQRDVEGQRPERRARLNAQHRRAIPRR